MDYYDILGVDKDASQDDIKKAYRRRARETHPDVNKSPEAEDEFKKISEAYSVLGDENKRKNYDNPTIPGFNGNLEDFLDAHFGRVRRTKNTYTPNTPKPGATVHVQVKISLFESIFGVKLAKKAEFISKCDNCNGLGGFDFTNTCSGCEGKGYQELNRGVMVFRKTCVDCSGTGFVPSKVCSVCEGSAKKKYTSDYNVELPPGFSGGVINVEGKGAPGLFGGSSGDLLLNVSITPPDINIDEVTEEEISVLRKYLS